MDVMVNEDKWMILKVNNDHGCFKVVLMVNMGYRDQSFFGDCCQA